MSSNVNWGDIPTWLATIAAIGGGSVALYQLMLTRRQLREQQETIAAEFQRQAKRDELVEAQLKQVQAANTALVRQQAEQIDVDPSQAMNPDPARKQPSDSVWTVIVRNGSRRPIYEVEGWIRPTPNEAPVLAASLGKRAMAPLNNAMKEVTRTWHSARRVAVIRSGEAFTFRFAYVFTTYPQATLLPHFTDDAGARWQLDHDMSLQPIDPLDTSQPDGEAVNVIEA